ncbi:MAG: ABC transporter ATP-binding protein [Chlorobiales bacterium]|nr:ABC transporter ATP-binding protein [Chlorobiales bacterium]
MPAFIHIENLSKAYQRAAQSLQVLSGISLSIEEGEFVALMGPSGSGKSTLLNLIAGLDTATSGRISVAGTELSNLSSSDLSKWRARHVGFIFQFYNLMPVLTAYENVELPLHLTHLTKDDRNRHIRQVLDLVGLGDRMHHYPNQLSGGQQQRVAIARAIVTDPSLIVADEPTGDLDRKSAEEVLTLLSRLNKELGKTIVMVTHDPHAAEKASLRRHLDKGELT